MGNSGAVSIIRKGNITLKITSIKFLTLTDVLHVLEMRKNLLSGTYQSGFKLNFFSNHLVMTRMVNLREKFYAVTMV